MSSKNLKPRNGLNDSIDEDLSSITESGEINRHRRLKEAIELYQETGNSQRLLDILSFSNSFEPNQHDDFDEEDSEKFVQETLPLRDKSTKRQRSVDGKNFISNVSTAAKHHKFNTFEDNKRMKRNHSGRTSPDSHPSFNSKESEKRTKEKYNSKKNKFVARNWKSLPNSDDESITDRFLQKNAFRSKSQQRLSESKRVASNTCEKMKAVLDLRKMPKEIKKSIGFGFSLKGGAEFGLGIYVAKILRNSVAKLCGLEVGDRILSVNGISFKNISSADAAEVLKSSDRLDVEFDRSKKVPGTFENHHRYIWINPAGMPCSPPAHQRQTIRYDLRGGSLNKGKEIIIRSKNERKIKIILQGSRKLGLLIRGGREYNLGIYVTGVEPGCLAAEAGIKTGDQILDVNGISFMDIDHQEAKRILSSSKKMIITLKDVGKIPYGMETYEGSTLSNSDESILSSLREYQSRKQTIPFESSHRITRQSSRSLPARKLISSSIIRKSRKLMEEGNFKLFIGYVKAYLSGLMEVEDMVEHMQPILNTRKRLSILGDLRSLIFAKDLETFDTMVIASGLQHFQPFEESRVSQTPSTLPKDPSPSNDLEVDDEWIPLKSALKEVFDGFNSQDELSPNKSKPLKVIEPRQSQSIQTDETYPSPPIDNNPEMVKNIKRSEGIQVCIDPEEKFNSLRAVEKHKRASMKNVQYKSNLKNNFDSTLKQHNRMFKNDVPLNSQLRNHTDEVIQKHAGTHERIPSKFEHVSKLDSNLKLTKEKENPWKRDYMDMQDGPNSSDSTKLPRVIITDSVCDEPDLKLFEHHHSHRTTLPKSKYLRRKDNWVLMSPDVFQELNKNPFNQDATSKVVIMADVHNSNEHNHTRNDNNLDKSIFGKTKMIEIAKIKPILGIAITGGSDTELAMPRVADIQENGAAFYSQLKTGDVILEVDGKSLLGLDHEGCAKLIVDCFRSNLSSTLKLLVADSFEFVDH